MKKFMTLAVIATLAIGVVGVKDTTNVPVSEMTQEQLSNMIIGSWVMDDVTLQEGGIDMKMYDGTAQYNSDGTSSGTAKMSIEVEEMPADMRGFQISGTSNWIIEGQNLRETMFDMSVTPLVKSEGSKQMAAAMQGQMQAAPVTVSKILSVSKKTLVLQPEGRTLTYTRK